MGIALVCDVPGCGDVISPEETEAILEEYGEDKPAAIEVLIDGERYMLLDDVCARHREQFEAVVKGFLSQGGAANSEKAAPAKKAAPAEGPKPSRKREVKIPGGIEEVAAESRGRSEAAAKIAVKPSELFCAPEADEAAPEPEKQPSAPQRAVSAPQRASSGPKPLKRAAQQNRKQEQAKPGAVAATLEDDGAETLIEPSLASVYDFSTTTPAV